MLPDGHPPVPLDASSCPYHADADPDVLRQANSTSPKTIVDTPPNTSEDPGSGTDPRNNMPLHPHQHMARGQSAPLSIQREVSSIPMGGKHDGKFWVYPSEQMFYNAMKRKNWEPNEKDMGVVVPIHNVVNEQCWKKILEWESVHQTSCAQPKLLKFIGRPREYSPKARFMNLIGYKLPFDRHDWYVDRCGKQVRYVIDFYGGNSDAPGVSFFLDVRPDLSADGLRDRIRRFWNTGTGLF
ncbi:hypothetical protein HDU83_002521 [Entophlyctis luteolus]|nr:hypothetical protein HDU83_002521 [Entophlyctis luteolus]